MNRHPHFTMRTTNFPEPTPNFDYVDEFMAKYENGELRLVGYDIKKDTPVYIGLDRENKPIYKKVSSIKEERPSKGLFNNHIRPTSYRVIVS